MLVLWQFLLFIILSLKERNISYIGENVYVGVGTSSLLAKLIVNCRQRKLKFACPPSGGHFSRAVSELNEYFCKNKSFTEFFQFNNKISKATRKAIN